MASNNKPNSKPRIIKDYDKLPEEVKEQILATYPQGFAEKLIQYPNKDGNLVSALPFETEDKVYLVKISIEDVRVVYADSEFDDDDDIKDLAVDEIAKADYMSETPGDDDDFEEKYSGDESFGPGIKDDGEDDDDEEVSLDNLSDEELDKLTDE